MEEVKTETEVKTEVKEVATEPNYVNLESYTKEITELKDTIKILTATIEELKSKPTPPPQPAPEADPYDEVW